MPAYHLAQINIGRILGPLDGPVMAGFMARLDELNALADGSPGFVWRLQTEVGNATALRPYNDERVLLNMSVWATLEDLRQYVYRSAHRELLAQRKDWFDPFEKPYLALWWVPAGHIPSVAEGTQRLARLQASGETAEAFTFKQSFAAPQTDDAGSRPALTRPAAGAG